MPCEMASLGHSGSQTSQLMHSSVILRDKSGACFCQFFEAPRHCFLHFLANELGDIAEAAEDPSILNQPVCGTTLLQVISGLAG